MFSPCAVLSPSMETGSQGPVLRDRQNERGRQTDPGRAVLHSLGRGSHQLPNLKTRDNRFTFNEVWSGSARSIAEANCGKYNLAHIPDSSSIYQSPVAPRRAKHRVWTVRTVSAFQRK